MNDTRQPETTRLEQARRFAGCPQDLRDWAEDLGYKNLKERMASGAAIAAQASATLTLLLATMGGAAAWAVQLMQPAPPHTAWGALAVAVYLAVLLVAMVHTVMGLRDAPSPYNRPGNLLVPGATLEQVRIGELANLDERIRQQTAANASRARGLNVVRLAAAAAPLVFAVATAAAWLLWR